MHTITYVFLPAKNIINAIINRAAGIPKASQYPLIEIQRMHITLQCIPTRALITGVTKVDMKLPELMIR
jgi:2'-5' RNA ligase